MAGCVTAVKAECGMEGGGVRWAKAVFCMVDKEGFSEN